MTPHYEDGGLRLFHGSNKDVLPTFDGESFDSIVCDPPYELGFMGKGWDSTGIAYDTDMWRECFRVLKPGGYLLAFGGTRTWHRIASAIEDAGFEIRDSIAWLYGSGFPKSMDVGKAIDKVRDDSDEVRVVCRWLRARIDEHPTLTVRAIAEYFGFHPRMVEHWAARDTDSQPTLPTLTQWDMLRDALGFSDELDAEVYRLNIRKGEPGDAWKEREVLGVQTGQAPGFMGKRFKARDKFVRGDGSDASKIWEGWGTALKPAFEPIVVARKPLIGTVAANVLAYGTGAINIDACRVGDGSDSQGDRSAHESSSRTRYPDRGVTDFAPTPGPRGGSPSGRFPPNVLLDESQAEALDEQAPETGGAGRASGPSLREPTAAGVAYGARRGLAGDPAFYGGEKGGASRFFPTFRYEAKAPGHERPEVDGLAHATVKPLALMRWLVRLVTRRGGHLLDPFAGSGTTGEAALLEGMEVTLIELEADHLPLILQRVRKPLQPSMFGDWEGGAA